MLNFFQMIGEYLSIVWEWFTNLLSSFLTLIVALTEAVTLPNMLGGFLFAPLGACVVSVVALAAIKTIVGR